VSELEDRWARREEEYWGDDPFDEMEEHLHDMSSSLKDIVLILKEISGKLDKEGKNEK